MMSQCYCPLRKQGVNEMDLQIPGALKPIGQVGE